MSDEYTAHLVAIAKRALRSPTYQPVVCGLLRSDYMIDGATNQLLQIELNTISCSFSGLEEKLTSMPHQLSGGQQQRVALARILAGEPKAILLDEPFSALDSYLKWSLEAELTQMLAAFSGPLVWVSHDLGECWRNCRTVCVLEQGRTGPRCCCSQRVQQRMHRCCAPAWGRIKLCGWGKP